MALWSLICVVTFLFARMIGSYDYRHFFRQLLGPRWFLFEAAYFFFFVLILAVYAAAAGAIGRPCSAGPRSPASCAWSHSSPRSRPSATASVEWLFKYASFFLYGVYALFVFFAFQRFGDESAAGLAVPAANGRLGRRRYHLHELQRPSPPR